uniref:ATPdependent RNA helicase putative n=1 Tax=Albugo laibachii Nc14 TaxID=890382 RepID=F0W1H6_9STRA|nr:ATPdependent RNA helicase putative [Albugo laibachii Nc14]|eukprot:CCA14905.1 ATPdependent RNA helicase putative [Albugo laibachii Nc14]
MSINGSNTSTLAPNNSEFRVPLTDNESCNRSKWISTQGYEFSKSEEQYLYENVFSQLRARQRTQFRSISKCAPTKPKDLILKQRTKSRLERILRSVSSRFDANEQKSQPKSTEILYPAELLEACRYVNTVEDALLFIAFQNKSDNLPKSLSISRLSPLKPLKRAHEKDRPDTIKTAPFTTLDDTMPMEKCEVDTMRQEAMETRKNQMEEVQLSSSKQWTKQFLQRTEDNDVMLPQEQIESLELLYASLKSDLENLTNDMEKKNKKKRKLRLKLEIESVRLQLLQLGWDSTNIDEVEAERHSRRKKPAEESEEVEMMLGCFMDAEDEAIIEKHEAPIEITCADLETPQMCLLKTPQFHLAEHCQKHHYRPPEYHSIRVKPHGRHLYFVSIEVEQLRGKKNTKRFTAKKGFGVWTNQGKRKLFECRIDSISDAQAQLYATQGFTTVAQAKNYVSTCALFALAPDLPLYLVLPPPFRAIWRGFLDVEKTESNTLIKEKKDRMKSLLDELLYAIPPEFLSDFSTLKDVEESNSSQAANALEIENWQVDDWDADLSGDFLEHPISQEVVEVQTDWTDRIARPHDCSTDQFHRLKSLALKRLTSSQHQAHAKTRADLPITQFRSSILTTLAQCDIMLLCGETGCGKSTQVPQILLESLLKDSHSSECFHIVCTQPRRLAAMSLASRVALELGEDPRTVPLGSSDSICGYHVRFDPKVHAQTRLVFCTVGILLRQLQSDTIGSHVTHLIVDEIHERDVQTDILLTLLKQLLIKQANSKASRRLKVILMSATVQASTFQSYFGGEHACPMLTVPGKIYEVHELFLEDVLEKTGFIAFRDAQEDRVEQEVQVRVTGKGGKSYTETHSWQEEVVSVSGVSSLSGYSDQTLQSLRELAPFDEIPYELITHAIAYLVSSTDPSLDTSDSVSILVFLPGTHEIMTLLTLLDNHLTLRDQVELIPLHSSLSAKAQQRAFDISNQHRIRVILATNIAETSLTIQGVRVVIDSGRAKELRHDPIHRTNVLETVWISQANCKQRKGRAGRTSAGLCLRLFPAYIMESMTLQPIPEIQRTSLTSLCLDIFVLMGETTSACYQEFLDQCLDPPKAGFVADALQELNDIGALEDVVINGEHSERLTCLGRYLSALPMDVKVGKMLVLGAVFNVYDAMATCAAIFESKSPFLAPYEARREMQTSQQRFSTGLCDVLTQAAAFETWQEAFSNSSDAKGAVFCRQHALDRQSLCTIAKLKTQFTSLMQKLGFVRAPIQRKRVQDHVPILSALLYASLAPNLVVNVPTERLAWRDAQQNIAYIHPTSVNHARNGHSDVSLQSLLERGLNTLFLTFHVRLETWRVHLPSTSLVTPVMLILFSAEVSLDMQLASEKQSADVYRLVVDGWIALECSLRSAMLLMGMRQVTQELLAEGIQNPRYKRASVDNCDQEKTLEAISSLLQKEHAYYFSSTEDKDR